MPFGSRPGMMVSLLGEQGAAGERQQEQPGEAFHWPPPLSAADGAGGAAGGMATMRASAPEASSTHMGASDGSVSRNVAVPERRNNPAGAHPQGRDTTEPRLRSRMVTIARLIRHEDASRGIGLDGDGCAQAVAPGRNHLNAAGSPQIANDVHRAGGGIRQQSLAPVTRQAQRRNAAE